MKRPINLQFALHGLGSSKLRSALTTLGIVIGVAAVITIVSLGQGLSRATKEQMESYGSGTIEVRPSMSGGYYYSDYAMSSVAVMGGSDYYSSPAQAQLTSQDVTAIEMLSTRVDGVSPQIEIYGSSSWNGESTYAGSILGVTPEWLNVYKRELSLGRFISDEDNQNQLPVVVIDEQLAEEVMGSINPIGQILHITVNEVTQNYTVIGVLAANSQYSSTRYNLLIPMETANVRLPGARDAGISMIALRMDDRDMQEREYALAEVNTILRASHKLSRSDTADFYLQDTLQYSESSTQFLQVVTIVLALIAGISLIVGSIGLMNIMLVTVSERTWEIGMRRAIGAQRSDIMVQFLTEAILLSLAGGLVGMGLGIAGSYGVAMLFEELQGHIVVTAGIVGIAVGVSTIVGVVSGLYPAWRAARLQPTEALRHMA